MNKMSLFYDNVNIALFVNYMFIIEDGERLISRLRNRRTGGQEGEE